MLASPEPLAAPQGLRPNQFYLQTQLQGCFQLCPPDLADPLGCTCTWVLSPELPVPWHPPSTGMPPPGGGIHGKKWAQGQTGLGLHCVWGGGLTPGHSLLPPTWACQGGAPCQPEWGLSLCLTTPQLLACCAIINVYVCRWPEPLCLLCYLAWTAGILGDCEEGDPSKASCWCLTQG